MSVDVTGSPARPATIPGGGAGAATISDTYSFTSGSLLVRKTIVGPGAGQQGPITIHTHCNGTALSPNFVIPAGTPAGSFSKGYDGIPAGSVCTVTEIADGSTDTITATVSGNGQKVTVPAGNVVPVNVVDAYELTPVPSPDVPATTNGFLKVTKTIAGPEAGRQGQIAILVTCGGPVHDYAFLIPPTTVPVPCRAFSPGFRAGAAAPSRRPRKARPARCRLRRAGKAGR